ncbi:MAG: STN domain-containing protein [Fimbriimonadaceae bacterium]|nr:STN domain-containing protein [Fimbriimonadaceae bacterium]
MQNDWKIRSFGVALAAIAAATVFAQWPFALPLLGINPDSARSQAQAEGRPPGKVTVSGNEVTAREVFDQLRKAGANFVVDAEAVPAEKKLSLNLVAQDPESAVKAVAKALGMTATKEGEILILAPAHTLAWTAAPWGAHPDAESEKLLEQWKEKLAVPGESFRFDFKDKDALKALPKILEKLQGGEETAVPGKVLEDLERQSAAPLDLAKLVKSLTPAQLEIHKAKGYLALEDLTPEQRKMLGRVAEGKGQIELSYNDGRTTITIRSK